MDFDYEQKLFENSLLEQLNVYLTPEIKTKYFSSLETKTQGKIRLYLKFPFLYKLGIAQKPESDKLYVKIETEDKIVPYASFAFSPISQFGFNFLAYHYDLPTLFAGKIQALLTRLWFKGKKQEIDIKGRDFYDLFWFLKSGVEPNWQTLKKLTGVKDKRQLKALLLERVKKNFLPEQEFVEDFSKNYKEIIKKYL